MLGIRYYKAEPTTQFSWIPIASFHIKKRAIVTLKMGARVISLLIKKTEGKKELKAKDFLTKGLLPKEFPSLFDSSNLNKALSVSDQILSEEPRISRSIKTSIPKGAGFRRGIMIPNPKHYQILAKFLQKKSRDIERFFALSDISKSKVKHSPESSRSVGNEFSFDQVMDELLLKGFSSKYLLKTDISKFYNTIYTHSIPWALHGKPESKQNRNDTLWGNKLDRLVRNMQDGQTLGIPTGPDASRVISEIIGISLDKQLRVLLPNVNCVRFIDDFFIFADTSSDAENFTAKLNRVLGEFELATNENKSSIQKMPVSSESPELLAIRNYKIRRNESEQKMDIVHLYNLAIEIYKNEPKQNAFHYFLTKVMPVKIHPENWPILESMLLQIATSETRAITVISKILVSYKSYGYDLDLDKIKIAFLKIAKNGITNNYGFEICWAFWVIGQIGVTIDNEIPELSQITDPLAVLAVLSSKESRVYRGSIDTSNWQNLMTEDGLYDSNWMLCYEAENRGWLSNQNGICLVDQNPYFKQLRTKGVSFLNMENTINPMIEGDLTEETDFDNEADIFDLIYGNIQI